MASDSEFWERYKDPRWQRKRLEIMEREDFTCEDCGAKDKTLNVHHGYYLKDAMPWEYPDSSLHCLCEDCHKEAQALLTWLKETIGSFHVAFLHRLFGYLWYPLVLRAGSEQGACVVPLRTERAVEGFASAAAFDAEEFLYYWHSIIAGGKEFTVEDFTVFRNCEHEKQKEQIIQRRAAAAAALIAQQERSSESYLPGLVTVF